MSNQATNPGAIVRHSTTELRFATGDLAKAQYVDAKHLDEALALLEQILTNAERGLPPDLHRALRAMIQDEAPQEPANEAEREPFEAWHCRRFATRHMTGAPTRDLHNGVRAPNYGPPNQQQMWEAWQARAALVQQ